VALKAVVHRVLTSRGVPVDVAVRLSDEAVHRNRHVENEPTLLLGAHDSTR
jgi:hypothetical protein